MNKFKKALIVLIVFCLAVFSLPTFVSANAPAPADHLTVNLSNIPDNAVYADLLIKIDKSDENYVDFQANSFADSASKAKSIVDYSDGGFYSFTFHYKNSQSNIKIENYYDNLYCVSFCEGIDYQEFLTQYESLLNHYNDIKIALLDKDFNIIAVSEAAQLPKESKMFNFYGDVYYDFNANTIEIDTQINPYFFLVAFVALILMISISVGAEILTALLFGFKNKLLITVLLVNLCSQIIMRALYFALPFSYLIETIVLEIIVYVVEFFVYKKHFKETSTAKILAYTVVANTVSLLLGMYLNCYFLY
ncbi:MAG: hypothetical protein IJY88_00820 [Clostridia bacterium]|nr:hypothetical protein [Clostridia bacterium]